MKVVRKPPPMFEEIVRAFPLVAGRPMLFAWGDAIHCLNDAELTPSLLQHETIHMQRQGHDPAAWWRRYIDDRDFRLVEEIPAHYAEYHYLLGGPRNVRRRALGEVARKLASTLYGSPPMVTLAVAKRILQVGPPDTPLKAAMYRSTAAAMDSAAQSTESDTR